MVLNPIDIVRPVKKLMRLLDRRTDLIATFFLGAGAIVAALFSDANVSDYLLAIGVLMHLAVWFGRWWEGKQKDEHAPEY